MQDYVTLETLSVMTSTLFWLKLANVNWTENAV